MNKKVLLAYAGGQEVDYLTALLYEVAKREESAYGYYMPSSVSREACACRAYVTIGEQTACKEFLPESADVLVALEELEGRRAVRFLAKEGVMILCAMHRLPMSVAVGTTGYPTDVLYRSVNEGRKVWQVKRAEYKPPFIAAMLLRALGYEKDAANELMAAVRLELSEDELAQVYAKKYSE